VRSLPNRERKCSAEELDEGGLATALGAEDEDAVRLLARVVSYSNDRRTYLKGVGSFLLLTRRGLLTVLTWLLA
jgi:hypothetical protein